MVDLADLADLANVTYLSLSLYFGVKICLYSDLINLVFIMKRCIFRFLPQQNLRYQMSHNHITFHNSIVTYVILTKVEI